MAPRMTVTHQLKLVLEPIGLQYLPEPTTLAPNAPVAPVGVGAVIVIISLETAAPLW